MRLKLFISEIILVIYLKIDRKNIKINDAVKSIL